MLQIEAHTKISCQKGTSAGTRVSLMGKWTTAAVVGQNKTSNLKRSLRLLPSNSHRKMRTEKKIYHSERRQSISPVLDMFWMRMRQVPPRPFGVSMTDPATLGAWDAAAAAGSCCWEAAAAVTDVAISLRCRLGYSRKEHQHDWTKQ